jgi:hypothetical protein
LVKIVAPCLLERKKLWIVAEMLVMVVERVILALWMVNVTFGKIRRRNPLKVLDVMATHAHTVAPSPLAVSLPVASLAAVNPLAVSLPVVKILRLRLLQGVATKEVARDVSRDVLEVNNLDIEIDLLFVENNCLIYYQVKS